MEYTYMGRTGLKVSRLCLGTMNFGGTTEEKEAFRIMDRALDAGINFFDTANMYGFGGNGYRGRTEEIIGKWFAQGGGRREKVVLATKISNAMNDPLDGPNDIMGLSGYKIRRHLEGCLTRLGTAHVELLYLHDPAPHAGWDELWGAFEAAFRRGQFDYIGGSNFAAWQLVKAQWEADKRHFMGLSALQDRYNLVSRLPEVELLPVTEELGLGLMCWGPLHGGMLSGSLLKKLESGQRSGKYAERMTPQRLEQLRRFHTLCADYGSDEATVSMAWLLSRPQVTAPLIGPRTIEQLEDSLKALEFRMTPELAEELDRLFPAPAVAAPLAYRNDIY